MNIPITKPVIGDEEVQAVAERLMSGWLVQGPKVAEFERVWSAYTGAKYSRATTSCTTALHLALVAIGIEPGDEVLVPAFTWIATANAVEYCSAVPKLVDIDLDTFNIDVSRLEQAITPKTKAILPVHEFGLSADLDALMSIAERHKLKVVEDCACACGSLYKGRHVGTFGDVGCFSFHPRKAISTGEGGMLTTNDAEYDHLFEVLRSHGADSNDLARHQSAHGFMLPEFNLLGFNYRMTDIQGALGVEQMKRLPWILEKRRARAHRYGELLSGVSGIKLPIEPDGLTHVYQSYVSLIEAGHDKRNQIAEKLQSKGIVTRQGTHAVHSLGYYVKKYGYKVGDCPNAWTADRQSLALPLYATMTDEEQDFVVQELRACL